MRPVSSSTLGREYFFYSVFCNWEEQFFSQFDSWAVTQKMYTKYDLKNPKFSISIGITPIYNYIKTSIACRLYSHIQINPIAVCYLTPIRKMSNHHSSKVVYAWDGKILLHSHGSSQIRFQGSLYNSINVWSWIEGFI